MNKKFACPICGYVHEGENAPELCPQCKQNVQWNVLEEGAALNFVTCNQSVVPCPVLTVAS